MESNQIQQKQYYELLDQVGCIMVPGCRTWGNIVSLLIFISVFYNKHEIHCHQRNYLKQHIHSQGMTVQY